MRISHHVAGMPAVRNPLVRTLQRIASFGTTMHGHRQPRVILKVEKRKSIHTQVKAPESIDSGRIRCRGNDMHSLDKSLPTWLREVVVRKEQRHEAWAAR